MRVAAEGRMHTYTSIKHAVRLPRFVRSAVVIRYTPECHSAFRMSSLLFAVPEGSAGREDEGFCRLTVVEFH